MKSVSNCIVCASPLSGKQRSFCSTECKNDHFLSYDVLKKRAYERKLRLIDASGGGCKRCGYSASLDALSFYNQAGETLRIDTNVLANSNYEKLVNKLQNAQVLCRNCVEEINATEVLDSSLRAQNDVNSDKLTKKFAENLVHCGVKPGKTLVLGVSGGVDSVTMLDLFAKSELKFNIIIAHMNHGVRTEAQQDEKLVKELTEKYGYKFVSTKIAKPKVGNLEEALRNERRKFLLATSNSNKADFVALAHNADDQAETFIMNAVRGSGPAGLSAMNMSDGLIIRPLLNVSRAEIAGYAKANNLTWNEDVTNQDISYSRNYVRHRILPLFTRLNPEFLNAIHRTTHLQEQIDSHFKDEAYRVMKNTCCEHLRRLDKPLLYEVLGLLYEETKGNRQNLTLAHLSAIEDLINASEGTKTLDLPDNISVKRSYDRLDFSVKLEHNTASAPSTKKLKLGTQRFGTWKVTVSTTNYQSMLENTKSDLIIDAENLSDLTIRARKEGDKIASIGHTGTKKLQDLFVDGKIDREKRAFWPIITNKKQILWIPSLAKANFQIKTKKLLKINIVEEPYETTEEK